jgi:transcriptional regulator with XRE-family HTH domain
MLVVLNKDPQRFVPIMSYLHQGKNLEEVFALLRKKHGWTQKQIAGIINSCHEVVSNYETGKRDLRTGEIIALSKFHPDFKLATIAFMENLAN